MKTIRVILTSGQLETVNKLLKLEGFASLDVEPLEIFQITDYSALALVRLSWIKSHHFDRIELNRLLDFADDVLRAISSKTANVKADKLISKTNNKIIDYVKY